MFESLRNNIEQKVSLSNEEFDTIKAYFTPKKLRRKQYLLQQGDPAKYLAFVVSGCLRSYSIDDRGLEHIIQFAIEDWWIGDPESQSNQGLATLNIDAVEDSELLLIEICNIEKLASQLPVFEKFLRLLQQKRFGANQHRMKTIISYTAEQKYADFMERYPHIAQRVPLHMVASYLGLTPETLSRVRKQMMGNG